MRDRDYGRRDSPHPPAWPAPAARRSAAGFAGAWCHARVVRARPSGPAGPRSPRRRCQAGGASPPAHGPCRSDPVRAGDQWWDGATRSFSSMVVAAATDVAVLDRRLVRHRLRAIRPVEVVAQDRDDRTVATRANITATQAGRLDALGAPGAHQSQDAQAGAEALLGMRLGVQDLLDQRRGGG